MADNIRKRAHNVKISVFVREGEEDPVPVESALLSLLPFDDLEKEKLEVQRIIAKGAKENRIFIFEVFLEKSRHVRQFMDFIKEKLSAEQRALLLEQADSRLDDGMNFFIRFDKDKLVEKRLLWITECGNCFHIRITVAAFPAKKDVGLGIVKEWLS